MLKITQWDVTKYGQMIERSDIVIAGIAIITTKIYYYQDKYYVEIWDNRCCINFSEIID